MTTVNVDPETGEILDIDGDLPPERAPIVVEARGLAVPTTPDAMIGLATQMATALKDIVERQRLYAVIQGKKYPQVEAWATIGRMDNVVAREADRPVRHEDGSFEAFVELIRLSDGMVVGRASALCGTPDDKPWASRPEYARRSMAVTRATSRGFRQQYSWIMALAGYEPTPADEMPHEPEAPKTRETHREPVGPEQHDGTVAVGKPPVDCELRETPTGMATGFSLQLERGRMQVLAFDDLAAVLQPNLAGLVGQTVTVWGKVEAVPWDKDGKAMPPYRRMVLERIQTPEWTLPAQDGLSSEQDQAELDAAAEGR